MSFVSGESGNGNVRGALPGPDASSRTEVKMVENPMFSKVALAALRTPPSPAIRSSTPIPVTPLATTLATLNKTPNSRYDTSKLADRLLLKFKDPGKILAALDHLTQHDVRFRGDEPGFSVSPADMETLRAALSAAQPQKKREATDIKTENVLTLWSRELPGTSSSTAPTPVVHEIDVDEADDEPDDEIDHVAPSTSPTTSIGSTRESLGESEPDDRNSSASSESTLSRTATSVTSSISSFGSVASSLSETSGSPKSLSKAEKKMAKLVQQVGHELVGLVTRKAVTCDGITQIAGHVEYSGGANPTFLPGRTISAELQKKEITVGELANHAILKDDSGHVVLSRSARSDTREKIEAKSIADIQERLNDPVRSGLIPIQVEGKTIYYLYERTDVTLMDTSNLKAFATAGLSRLKSAWSILRGKGPTLIENEKAFVANKKKATKDLFKDAKIDPTNNRKYIKRDFQVGQPPKTVSVHEYEPLIFNFVFSGQAKKKANVKQAREDNIPAALGLFKSYIASHPGLESYSAKLETGSRSALITKLQEDIPLASEDPDKQLALKAILVALTGECRVGDKVVNFDNKDGTHVQFMLMCHLSPALSVECKSGNDRTILATALACAYKSLSQPAQDAVPAMPATADGEAKPAVEARPAKPFDPTLPVTKELRDTFTTYLIGLGQPNLVASRGMGEEGKPEVKIAKSPVYQLLTDADNKAEIHRALEVV